MSPVGFSPRTRSNEDWEAAIQYFNTKVREIKTEFYMHNDPWMKDRLEQYTLALNSIINLVNFLVTVERPNIGDTAAWGMLNGAIAARLTHVRGAQREATEDFQRFMLNR